MKPTYEQLEACCLELREQVDQLAKALGQWSYHVDDGEPQHDPGCQVCDAYRTAHNDGDR